MIFSKRMELGKQLDEWCEEHNAVKKGMNYLSALNAMGYDLQKPPLSCSAPATGSVTQQYEDSMMAKIWKCSKCEAAVLTYRSGRPDFCSNCGIEFGEWFM
jgi:hypothetical protein